MNLLRGKLEEGIRIGEHALVLRERLGGHPYIDLDAALFLIIAHAAQGHFAAYQLRSSLRWLFIRSMAWPVETPDLTRLLPRWFSTLQPDALFLMVRVLPRRIDLVDEDAGRGLQETLEW